MLIGHPLCVLATVARTSNIHERAWLLPAEFKPIEMPGSAIAMVGRSRDRQYHLLANRRQALSLAWVMVCLLESTVRDERGCDRGFAAPIPFDSPPPERLDRQANILTQQSIHGYDGASIAVTAVAERVVRALRGERFTRRAFVWLWEPLLCQAAHQGLFLNQPIGHSGGEQDGRAEHDLPRFRA